VNDDFYKKNGTKKLTQKKIFNFFLQASPSFQRASAA
jgi:hypothetical protein